jgi:hypothetical protein
MAAKSKKFLTINLPFEQVMPAIEQALIRMGTNISTIDRTSGHIKAKKRMNLATWGDNITITVVRSPNGCSVDIISECALPTQIIDWGSNQGNIQTFEYWLNNILVQVTNGNKILSSGLICPICYQVVPDGAKNCPNDGTPIGCVCSNCKANNIPNANYCTSCGTQLKIG